MEVAQGSTRLMQKPSIKQAAAGTLLIGAAAVTAFFMAPLEGEKFISYPDGGGVWTICRGHTKDVHEGMTATRKQCDAWYIEDVREAEEAFDAKIPAHFLIPQNTKAAVTSFIFNTGAGSFNSSTLLKRLKKYDIVGACNELPRWKRMSVPVGDKRDLRDGVRDGKADCSIRANNCYGVFDRRLKEKELCLEKDDCNSYSFGSDNAGNYWLQCVQNP